ncbi:MAG: hypothetical protein JNM63_03900, partial [Spirochaetia bacterium]|nr:hypothetical protein [Spirochaetia bacterium]
MKFLWLVSRGIPDPAGFGFSSNSFEIQKGCEFQAEILGIHLEPHSRDAFLKSGPGKMSFDAAICIGSGMTEDQIAAWDAYGRKFPSFLVYRDIRSDEERDVPLLVEHLMENGCRKIGFFSLDEQVYTRRRHAAFAETIRKWKLEARPEWTRRLKWGGKEVGPAYRSWSVEAAGDFLKRSVGRNAV